MQLHKLSSSNEVNEPQIDIFRLNYPGAGRFQTGSFVITAASLGRNGEATGGGIVAEFANEQDAINCRDKIVEINAKHEPVISTYEEIYLGEERQFMAAQLRERKAKNESSFNKEMRRQNRHGKKRGQDFPLNEINYPTKRAEQVTRVETLELEDERERVKRLLRSRKAKEDAFFARTGTAIYTSTDNSDIARYLKNPLEFDTQTRKEAYAKDNGQLPPRVAIDYRLIGNAFSEEGLENPERSTKAPFPTAGLIGSSRYRTGQLWMEERVAEFSGLSPEDILIAKEEEELY